LRAGYDNALAIEGAKIDETIKDLCAKKDKVVAFLDGDRAGGFILKELKSVVNIDLELRADEGVEVEELTPQRVADILKAVTDDVKQQTAEPKEVSEADKPLAEATSKVYQDLNETLEAIGLDSDNNQLFKVPISELVEKLSTQSGIKYLILDGIITQRLLDGAKQSGIECIIGHRIANLSNSDGITLKTFTELGIS